MHYSLVERRKDNGMSCIRWLDGTKKPCNTRLQELKEVEFNERVSTGTRSLSEAELLKDCIKSPLVDDKVTCQKSTERRCRSSLFFLLGSPSVGINVLVKNKYREMLKKKLF